MRRMLIALGMVAMMLFARAAFAADQIRDRSRDQTRSTYQTRTQDQTRSRDQLQNQTKDRIQTRDRLKEGSTKTTK